MLKPTFKNILLYIFCKYLLFYVFMMFRNNDFALIYITELKTLQDLFYYLWIFLFFPILISVLFLIPIYYSFKAKSIVHFAIRISLILIVEYFIYTYLASQKDLINGVYNIIISILFLGLFFYKHIASMFKKV
jgi:hypothetical protein